MGQTLQVKLERNLTLSMLYQGAFFLLFMQPIVIFYYQTKGITVAEFFYLQPIFSVALVFFALFCGHLSDTWGRCKCLTLSAVAQIMANGGAYFAESVWELIPSSLLFALSVALFKSAQDAMLFDTLVSLDRANEHKKLLGRNQSFGHYCLGVSSAVAGVVYSFNIQGPLVLSVCSGFLCLCLGVLLTDPPRHKEIGKKNPLTEMASVVKYIAKGHHELKWIILFSSVVSVACLKGFWTIQPLALELGASVILVGFISAFCRFISGFSAQMTHKFEDKIKLDTLFKAVIVLGVCSFVFASFSESLKLFAFAPLLLIFISSGVSGVVNGDLVQNRVSSNIRGKVLSVEMIVQRMLFSILTPIFGYFVGAISLQFAMISIAIYLGVLGVLCYVMLKKTGTL